MLRHTINLTKQFQPNRRRLKLFNLNFGTVLLLYILLAIFISTPASATADPNLDFTSFVADYYLTESDTGISQLKIREILTIDFPEPHKTQGITRIIPRTNQNGANKIVNDQNSLNLTVTRNGTPILVAEIIESPDSYTVRLGQAGEYIQGIQVYTLEYDFSDVITEFSADGTNVSGTSQAEAWQSFTWDLGLDDWHQSFNLVAVNLHLPPAVVNNLSSDPTCEVPTNSNITCAATPLNDGYHFAAENFATSDTMTLDLRFVPGTFTVLLGENFIAVIILVIELVLSFILLTSFYLKWRHTARTHQRLYRHMPVIPQKSPPDNLSLAEAAILYHKRSPYPYVATLLEMAVTQKVIIKTIAPDTWQLILKVNPQTLPQPELETLRILANRRPLKKDTIIPLEPQKADNTLAQHALAYQKSARTSLLKKGYLVPRPPRHRFARLGFILLCVAIWVILTIIVLIISGNLDFLQPSPNSILVGGPALLSLDLLLPLPVIIGCIYFHRQTIRYRRYTLEGIRLARELDGFEQHLRTLTNPSKDLIPWLCLFGLPLSHNPKLQNFITKITASLNLSIYYTTRRDRD